MGKQLESSFTREAISLNLAIECGPFDAENSRRLGFVPVGVLERSPDVPFF
jgi:hypothetical protein